MVGAGMVWVLVPGQQVVVGSRGAGVVVGVAGAGGAVGAGAVARAAAMGAAGCGRRVRAVKKVVAEACRAREARGAGVVTAARGGRRGVSVLGRLALAVVRGAGAAARWVVGRAARSSGVRLLPR